MMSFIKNRDVGRGSADGGRWSGLRRLTLERLIPARRACSGEELTASRSEATPLPIPRGGRSQPFLPHYESTGSSPQYPPNAELCKRGLHQSAPSVCNPASCNGKRRKTAWRSLHPFISVSGVAHPVILADPMWFSVMSSPTGHDIVLLQLLVFRITKM